MTPAPPSKKVVSTFPGNYTDLYISHDFVTFLYSSVSNCRPSHLPILISMSRKSLPTIINMFLSYLPSPIFADFNLNMYLSLPVLYFILPKFFLYYQFYLPILFNSILIDLDILNSFQDRSHLNICSSVFYMTHISCECVVSNFEIK